MDQQLTTIQKHGMPSCKRWRFKETTMLQKHPNTSTTIACIAWSARNTSQNTTAKMRATTSWHLVVVINLPCMPDTRITSWQINVHVQDMFFVQTASGNKVNAHFADLLWSPKASSSFDKYNHATLINVGGKAYLLVAHVVPCSCIWSRHDMGDITCWKYD